MIEVFRTNVECPHQAQMLLARIHAVAGIAHANFDLQDCDRILRIQAKSRATDLEPIRKILSEEGYFAVPLPD